MTKTRVLPWLLLFVVRAVLEAQSWPASARIDAIVDQAIQQGTIPGAVMIVGHRGQILHRKAYGNRSLQPQREAMTLDTVFDCASLTKVVATAPAVMQLVEQGKIRLGDRVTKHLPGFADGKSEIRLRDLLTHFSGLRPDLDLEPEWDGYETGIQKAYREVPVAKAGERFIYSDINFILLAEVVRQVSGQRLDEYAKRQIFDPLGMNDTQFLPPAAQRGRIAPTERFGDGTILRGVVHDPSTRFMGGVTGHAGVFSTGGDLSRFAEMMLQLGRLDSVRVLSPLSVLAMTTAQTPPGQRVKRGLGWDIDSPYSSPRGDLFPIGSYGHSGFTGTSVWIDPFTKTYVILLTSRLHAGQAASVVSLRSRLANVVAAWLEEIDENRIRPSPNSIRISGGAQAGNRQQHPVLTGLDVLAREEFQALRGKRVGLITNHTGIDRLGRRNIDLLHQAEAVTLAAIFSPEHGLTGRLDHPEIGDTVDVATGLPVYSLYRGKDRRPRAELLQKLDVLMFDIQDVGSRFYTYVTTMAYAMEEAAKQHLPFYVLDRPNPITGDAVEGPLLDEENRSFIGYFPVPVRHGMTAGELARLFNEERRVGAQLTVVGMQGWRRKAWFDETGLPWVDPSPNIRTVEQALLYPGIALLEGFQNCSVGRGTGTPFQFVGADWIKAEQLAAHLNRMGLEGARFYPIRRRPTASRFQNVEVEGIQISVLDRTLVRPTRVGLEILSALLRLHPGRLQVAEAARHIGDQETLHALIEGGDPTVVWKRWQAEIEKFQTTRRRYLLY